MNRKYASIIITATFILLLAWYIFSNLDDFESLLSVNPWVILAVMFGHFGAIYANGLFIGRVMVPFGIEISKRDGLIVAVAAAAGNFFFPVGSGTGIRAVYLKKKHNLNYTNFLSTLYGNYIIAFFFSALVGLSALLMMSNNEALASINTMLGLIFLGIIIVCLALSSKKLARHILGWVQDRFKIRLVAVLTKVVHGWVLILKNKSLLTYLLTFALMNFAFQVSINYFSFFAVDIQINILSLIVYTALGSLSILVNITPGSIGAKEAIFIFFSSVLSLSPADILAVAVIDRTSRLLVIGALWTLYRKEINLSVDSPKS